MGTVMQMPKITLTAFFPEDEVWTLGLTTLKKFLGITNPFLLTFAMIGSIIIEDTRSTTTLAEKKTIMKVEDIPLGSRFKLGNVWYTYIVANFYMNDDKSSYLEMTFRDNILRYNNLRIGNLDLIGPSTFFQDLIDNGAIEMELDE